MAGLIDLIRTDYFKQEDDVVFIHTGGTVGLFAYRDIFSRCKVLHEANDSGSGI